MANTQSNNKLSFAYSYGFTEGKVHSKKLTKLLKQAGYIPSSSPEKADIVIAHSAGCWYKIESFSPKLLIYVGMPLPTGNAAKIWFQSNKITSKALIKQKRRLRLIKSICLNALYLLRHPFRNFAIINKVDHAEPRNFKESLVVFVSNQHDPWPKTNRLKDLVHGEPWSFISLKGTHNNLWHEPDKYVKLIDHYARLLAKTDH